MTITGNPPETSWVERKKKSAEPMSQGARRLVREEIFQTELSVGPKGTTIEDYVRSLPVGVKEPVSDLLNKLIDSYSAAPGKLGVTTVAEGLEAHMKGAIHAPGVPVTSRPDVRQAIEDIKTATRDAVKSERETRGSGYRR